MATSCVLVCLAVSLCYVTASMTWPEERGDLRIMDASSGRMTSEKRNPTVSYRMGYLFGKRSPPDSRFLKELAREKEVRGQYYRLSSNLEKLLPLSFIEYLQLRKAE